MKRLLLFSLFAVLCLIPSAQAQLDVFGTAGAGVFKQDGTWKIGVFGGGDLKVMFDSAKGVSIFNRAMVLYSKFKGSFQGGADFVIVQKRLGLLRDMYIGFGPGLYYRIRDGADEQQTAIRFILGSDFLGDIGIDVGADYIPSIPTGDPSEPATTRWFFHGAVNLYPRL